MADVLTFQPSNVKLIIENFTVTGIVSLALEWGKPAFKVIEGCGGINTRVHSLDTSATITVTLLQTSVSNDVFGELVTQDRLYKTGMLSVVLRDQLNGVNVSTDVGFIPQLPNMAFSDDFSDKEWKIYLPRTNVSTVKGNNTSIVDIIRQYI